MPTCTNCGELNPDNTSRCNKCGVVLTLQARHKVDAARSKAAWAGQTTFRIIMLVVVLIAAPLIYHAGFGAYYNYRLNTVKEAAMKECGGPPTATMQPYEKEQVNKCLSNDTAYTNALNDFNNFNGKH